MYSFKWQFTFRVNWYVELFFEEEGEVPYIRQIVVLFYVRYLEYMFQWLIEDVRKRK